ncbi:DUF4336 domain-containing protein [Martelella limonii]|uniref:DUF4336 domain-containing protein n=1 Tax=Martelella limonii TaxID=1647649 RepID=UPI00157FE849|nr:DUF4336 domain-containing protein [Martelella limonii]
MLENIGSEIWVADGTPATAHMGFRYPTRMAVIRLSDETLLLWSPVATSQELMREVGARGTPKFLVAPNTLHHVFLPDWAQAFPDCAVLGPRALAQKRPDIAFSGSLEAAAGHWPGELDVVVLDGNRIMTETVFFHHASRTAIFTDLIQHFERGWFRGWRGLVARMDAMEGCEPAVPRKFRVAFTDRSATRQKVDVILGWPTEQVLFAHGAPVRREAKAFLERAFRWLY